MAKEGAPHHDYDHDDHDDDGDGDGGDDGDDGGVFGRRGSPSRRLRSVARVRLSHTHQCYNAIQCNITHSRKHRLSHTYTHTDTNAIQYNVFNML